MEITESDVKSYVIQALVNPDFTKYEVFLTGNAKETDGFCSHIVFATFVATTKDGAVVNTEVAVKISKRDLMKTHKFTYEREICVYRTIFPELTRFQIEYNIENVFESFPRCYKTISENQVEVIVMENLLKSGYVMHDAMKPLDLHHLKFALEEFGKFHALTFALRDRRKEDFEKLMAPFNSVLLESCNANFLPLVRLGFSRTCDILKELNEVELCDMFYNLSENGADTAMTEILKIDEPQSAILHGDCWNNNILYKYNSDHQKPSKVSFIDWQLSSLHSPVLDLSYLIYITCSNQELTHFTELLHVYHSSFSKCLEQFGCDPEKLFSYSDLEKHWRRYSWYGVLIASTLLHIPLSSKASNLDITESNSGKDWEEKLLNVKKKNEIEYRKRLISVIRHYYEYCYK